MTKYATGRDLYREFAHDGPPIIGCPDSVPSWMTGDRNGLDYNMDKLLIKLNRHKASLMEIAKNDKGKQVVVDKGPLAGRRAFIEGMTLMNWNGDLRLGYQLKFPYKNGNGWLTDSHARKYYFRSEFTFFEE